MIGHRRHGRYGEITSGPFLLPVPLRDFGWLSNLESLVSVRFSFIYEVIIEATKPKPNGISASLEHRVLDQVLLAPSIGRAAICEARGVSARNDCPRSFRLFDAVDANSSLSFC